MQRWIIAVVVLSAPVARAEPQTPLLPGPGNLRVGVTCAEHFATPDRGLDVRVDGVPVPPARINEASSFGTDSEGKLVVSTAVSDVGYQVPEGRHHVRVAASECAPFDADLDVGAVPHFVDGRLALVDSKLASPTAAPDGMTVAIGAMRRPIPASLRTGTTNPVFPSEYTIDDGDVHSLWLASGIERRAFVFALDLTFGGGSVAGTTRETDPSPLSGSGPYPFTGTLLESSLAIRIGARVALGNVALAAGSGIGGRLWAFASSDVEMGTDDFVTAQAPSGPVVSWFVPVWAAATYKPGCNWGVQALASSERTPGTGGGTTTLGVGLVFQPVAACSERAGVSLR